jgi:predicted acyl esterase
MRHLYSLRRQRRFQEVGRGPVAGRSVEQWTLGMTSFIRSQRGGRTRYDQDNRRVQRGALSYTTESLWVAHVDDVAPDGVCRPLTQGALLDSHRALDPERTWYLPDGTVLKPHHISTRAGVKPVVPGELTRYDVEIFPTAALIEPGHRLRLTVATFDFPHLVPTAPARRNLAGGTYRLHHGGPTPSHLLILVADPDRFD